MDGDQQVACIIVVCITILECGNLFVGRDGWLFGLVISALNGVVLWLKSRKKKGR